MNQTAPLSLIYHSSYLFLFLFVFITVAQDHIDRVVWQGNRNDNTSFNVGGDATSSYRVNEWCELHHIKEYNIGRATAAVTVLALCCSMQVYCFLLSPYPLMPRICLLLMPCRRPWTGACCCAWPQKQPLWTISCCCSWASAGLEIQAEKLSTKC